MISGVGAWHWNSIYLVAEMLSIISGWIANEPSYVQDYYQHRILWGIYMLASSGSTDLLTPDIHTIFLEH